MENQVLVRPVITEKTASFHEQNKYVFVVSTSSNKIEIEKAVEKKFGVTVEKVNTVTAKPKEKRVGRFIGKKKGYKKAIITLAKGDKIEYYED